MYGPLCRSEDGLGLARVGPGLTRLVDSDVADVWHLL